MNEQGWRKVILGRGNLDLGAGTVRPGWRMETRIQGHGIG